MATWSSRPLQAVYAAIFIDAIYVKVRDGQVGNQPFYSAIGSTWPVAGTCSGCGPARAAARAQSSG